MNTPCENCGGLIDPDVTELEDSDIICKCGGKSLSLNEKLDQEADRIKQHNKRLAEHWSNGRETQNGW